MTIFAFNHPKELSLCHEMEVKLYGASIAHLPNKKKCDWRYGQIDSCKLSKYYEPTIVLTGKMRKT